MATYYSWTGAGDGTSWSDPKNWDYGSSPATAPPNADDDVVFPTDATITDSGAAQYVTVDDSLTVNGGSISTTYLNVKSGTLDLEGGGSLSAAGANGIIASVFQDDTTLDVSGGGSLLSTSSLYFTDTGNLTISDGGSVEINGISAAADYALILGYTYPGQDDTITGAGSSLATTGGIAAVGYDEHVYLSILDGASASFQQSDDTVDVLEIGKGGDGEIEVSGDGSSLTSTSGTVALSLLGGLGFLSIDGGSAEFSQTTNSVPVLIIGAGGVGSSAHLSLEDDATLTATGSYTQIAVGDDSLGTLELGVGTKASFSNVSSDDIALEIGVGGTGEATVDDATLETVTGGLEVGVSGPSGQLSIGNGGKVMVNSSGGASSLFAVGVNAGSVGSVSNSGQDSTLVVSTSAFIIGDGGSGTVEMSGDGTLTYTGAMLTLGALAGSDGELELQTSTQTGSPLNYEGPITIGAQGDALFQIYASATSANATIGAEAGSSGEADDEGDWNVKGSLTVGKDGAGKLVVEDGGTLEVHGEFEMAMESGSSASGSFGYADVGSINKADAARPALSGGANTKIILYDLWTVGGAGTATFSITNPYEVFAAGGVTLGAQAGGNGTLNVDDALLNIGNADLIIGGAGTGLLSLANNAVVDAEASDVTIADDAMSNGTLNESGGQFQAGTLTIGASGTGTLYQTGGTVSVASDLTLGSDAQGNGSATFYNKGATLTVDGDTVVGDAGTANLTASDASVDLSGALTIGAQGGSNGSMYLNADTLVAAGPITVGEGGSGLLSFNVGAKLDNDTTNVTLGEKSGANGTLNAYGSGSSASVDELEVGAQGQAYVNLSTKAKLSAENVDIATATGTNDQTVNLLAKSVFSVGENLSVGQLGYGTLNVKAESQATVSGDVAIGDEAGAIGVATISGSATNASTKKTSQSSLGYGDLLQVGAEGSGQLQVRAGALVAPVPGGEGVVEIAAETGSFGVVTLGGKGSTLEGTSFDVGGTATAAGGTATLSIGVGASAVFTGVATVWSTAKISDVGDLSIGGALSGNGTIKIGSGGTLSLGGGDKSVGLTFAAKGKNDELDLVAHALPTIHLAGFATSDVVDINGFANTTTIEMTYATNFATVDFLNAGKIAGALHFTEASGHHDVFHFNATTGALTLALSG